MRFCEEWAGGAGVGVNRRLKNAGLQAKKSLRRENGSVRATLTRETPCHELKLHRRSACANTHAAASSSGSGRGDESIRTNGEAES